MGLIRISLVWIVIIVINIISRIAFAGYSGPDEIVSGGWGVNDGQFSIEYSEPQDVLPRTFGVASNGYIVISDTINKRIKIYAPSGLLFKIVSPQGLPADVMQKIHDWPDDITSMVSNSYVLTMTDKYIQLYSFDGQIMGTYTYPTIMGSPTAVLIDGSFITEGGGTNYYKYSSSGQLLQSYNTKPLELGVIEKEARQADKSYKINIKYPERTYTINVPRQSADFITRDTFGYLYSTQRLVDKLPPDSSTVQYIQHYRVIRFNSCGKETARLDLPNNISELSAAQPIIGRVRTVIAEYGRPVIAPNGDVYTWKRTPDKYSILKWTWVDDPNVPTGPDAPTNLAVAPSINGLYLTWTASPQDPGCVTGYEIAQATTSGGVYTTIATVNAGVLKYNDTTATVGTTYYYKVRAMAGSDPSTYTMEVSGKR